VKIDIEDSKETEQMVGKKKSTPSAQSVIKVTGRQRNAEETKKRILAQVEKMADETIEVLRIPRQYHSAIIGTQGKYIQRLQDKYSVKISMPKEDASRLDEVIIKGGKKGVGQAKQEIDDVCLGFLACDCLLIFSPLQLVEFEKESNNIVSFTVPSRAVSRILGQKGSKVNEITDDSGAHIDVAKDDSGTTTITLRGTKKACATAKTAILAIADSVEDEVSVTIKIEPKFHRTIIGGGGVGLKNLLVRVGGPTDPREQAGLVRLYVRRLKLSYSRNDID
jgi:predicted PilT family ATPase